MRDIGNIFIYGYGNPGRQDDGLGNALVEKVEDWLTKKQFNHISLDSNYQLNVEDAAEIYDKDLVIFADASIEEHIKNFEITRVSPSAEVNFTMHTVSPGYVLNLCQTIYGYHPPAYLLHIRGYEWEMKESLSEQAQQNLNKAFDNLKEIISNPELLEMKKSD